MDDLAVPPPEALRTFHVPQTGEPGDERSDRPVGRPDVGDHRHRVAQACDPVEHPARMTHASAAGSPLEVPADLVRLSVGIETAEDLVADLAHALA